MRRWRAEEEEEEESWSAGWRGVGDLRISSVERAVRVEELQLRCSGESPHMSDEKEAGGVGKGTVLVGWLGVCIPALLLLRCKIVDDCTGSREVEVRERIGRIFVGGC